MNKSTDEDDLREIFDQLKHSDSRYIPDFHQMVSSAPSKTRSRKSNRSVSLGKVVSALAAMITVTITATYFITNKERTDIAEESSRARSEAERLNRACDDFLVIIRQTSSGNMSDWRAPSDQFLTHDSLVLWQEEMP